MKAACKTEIISSIISNICKYSSGYSIPEVKKRTIKADILYSASLGELSLQAQDEMLHEAKRKVREIPVCNFTQKPVNILIKVNYLLENDSLEAVYSCPYCKTKKQEDDVPF